MRKVIESTLVSVDGVIGEPHSWTGDHFNEKVVALGFVLPQVVPDKGGHDLAPSTVVSAYQA